MPMFGGMQGQREVIHRGERTDPKMVVRQAMWGAGALCGAILIIEVLIAWWLDIRLRWIIRDLRAWLTAPVISFALFLLLAAAMLVIEVVDPNWPNPRKAISSTRPLTPLSRERGGGTQSLSRDDRESLRRLLDSLEDEDDD